MRFKTAYIIDREFMLQNDLQYGGSLIPKFENIDRDYIGRMLLSKQFSVHKVLIKVTYLYICRLILKNFLSDPFSLFFVLRKRKC